MYKTPPARMWPNLSGSLTGRDSALCFTGFLRSFRFFSRLAGSRGASVVESSVVALGFLSLVFGIMEGGRFMSLQQGITHAAREGARMAVAPASQSFTLPDDSQIEARVGYFLESNGIPVTGSDPAQVTVERNVTVGSAPDQFTRVNVRYPYKIMSLSMFSALQFNLTATARMRNETSP